MRRPHLLAPLCFLSLAACSGKGNSGKLAIDPGLIEQVPWTNGAKPAVNATTGRPLGAPFPVFPAIAANTPDPGSGPVDCSALDSLELSGWRQHFEPPPIPADTKIADPWGIAPYWSAYDDGSVGSWHSPGDAAWYDGLAGRSPEPGVVPDYPARRALEPWGLASDLHPVDSTGSSSGPVCENGCVRDANGACEANKWVLHVKGGRFNNYGGGVEHPLSLDCAQQATTAPDLCGVPEAAGQYGVFDVSSYDGIAFWARRGPDSDASLMVGLQNKYTSDFLARGNQEQFCRRIKECALTCANGAECKPIQTANDATPILRCVAAGAEPTLVAEPALMELLYPTCGANACTPPSYFSDPQFAGTECKPYTFSGLEENYWCFGEQPPAAPGERCGDGFVAAISLSTDWQLYKLPFEIFQQVGFAKRAPKHDLTSLYSIAFQFSVGWTDFYVDNVSFYRNK
jgi:hypothetical protein